MNGSRRIFNGSDSAVIDHLESYAEPELKKRLKAFDSIDSYRYDWSLNEAE